MQRTFFFFSLLTLEGAQMSDLTMTFNNQCSLLGAFSAAGFDVAKWLTMTMATSTMKPW